jgi:hypothetical protein
MSSIEHDLGYKVRRALLAPDWDEMRALAPSVIEEYKVWNLAQDSKKLWGPSNLLWDIEERTVSWRKAKKREILEVIFSGMYPDTSSARVRYMHDLKMSHNRGWNEGWKEGFDDAESSIVTNMQRKQDDLIKTLKISVSMFNTEYAERSKAEESIEYMEGEIMELKAAKVAAEERAVAAEKALDALKAKIAASRAALE